jgi:toxin-antitoxin system PIN domain toxin
MRRLVDTNIWLALAISSHASKAFATNWFRSLGADDELLFCRSTQQSFLRLATNATILKAYGAPPLTNAEAWTTYDLWLDTDRVSFAEEPPGLVERWRTLSTRSSSSPRLWMDAYLAAFALAAGIQMVTLDAGFRQFHGLDLLVLGR